MPERVSAPLLLMWSVPEPPLSVASATPGAVGAVVSSVKLSWRRWTHCRPRRSGEPEGVEALNRGERAGPGLAVVDRVLNDRTGLDAGEGQRAAVADVVGPGAAAVSRQRHTGAAGGVSSTVSVCVADGAGLPAVSDTRRHFIGADLPTLSRLPGSPPPTRRPPAVVVKLPTTLPVPSRIVTVTVRPSAPATLPPIAKPACALLKLTMLFPLMAAIEIEVVDVVLAVLAVSVAMKG